MTIKQHVQQLILLVSFMPTSIFAIGYAPIINLNIDNSQNVAIEAGGIFDLTDINGWTEAENGLVLSLEPGTSGTKMHIGLGGIGSNSGGGFITYRATWTELKMNKDNGKFSNKEDYAGIELFFGALIFNIQLGYLKGKETNDGLYTFGLGFGI